MDVITLVSHMSMETNISNFKTQCNAENACVNWMWQRGFKVVTLCDDKTIWKKWQFGVKLSLCSPNNYISVFQPLFFEGNLTCFSIIWRHPERDWDAKTRGTSSILHMYCCGTMVGNHWTKLTKTSKLGQTCAKSNRVINVKYQLR